MLELQIDALVMSTCLRGRAKQPQCFWLIQFLKLKVTLVVLNGKKDSNDSYSSLNKPYTPKAF